jgi:hypothetical protein
MQAAAQTGLAVSPLLNIRTSSSTSSAAATPVSDSNDYVTFAQSSTMRNQICIRSKKKHPPDTESAIRNFFWRLRVTKPGFPSVSRNPSSLIRRFKSFSLSLVLPFLPLRKRLTIRVMTDNTKSSRPKQPVTWQQ